MSDTLSNSSTTTANNDNGEYPKIVLLDVGAHVAHDRLVVALFEHLDLELELAHVLGIILVHRQDLDRYHLLGVLPNGFVHAAIVATRTSTTPVPTCEISVDLS